MNAKDLYTAVGTAAADSHLEYSEKRRLNWLRPVLAAAACAALVLLLWPGEHTDLGNGVTLRYEDPRFGLNATSSSSMLVALTEEEMLFPENWETDIFQGEVIRIQNISLDFNGRKSWRAIAEVAVDKVWRGALISGDTVSILLPCSVDEGQWVEDTDTVVHMREGMRGIFMPIRYDADSIWQENGATLYLQKAAPYGFADGLRFAFLETDRGLVYARHAWPSFAGASTLEALGACLEELLER